jgi:hypothetical protein
MKLRNKKTGEIKDALEVLDMKQEDGVLYKYYSMSELNEDWEDYEEPKEYWFIDEYGMVQHEIDYYYDENKSAVHDKRLEVGNYFETKEEAEKAVDKLKAWKRLKDKGFKFIGKTYETDKRFGSIFYEVDKDTYSEDIIHELDLLFGGEEDDYEPTNAEINDLTDMGYGG